jgi:hypothetical protein
VGRTLKLAVVDRDAKPAAAGPRCVAAQPQTPCRNIDQCV